MEKFEPHVNALEEEAGVLLAVTETDRRKSSYGAMNAYATQLRRKLEGSESKSAHKIRCKLFYELHMAFRQQAEEEVPGVKREHFFSESLRTAQLSITEANSAEDPAGRLYSEMSIGGKILPGLGRWREGLDVSRKVIEEAEALAADIGDEDERMRMLRIPMNSYFHAIEIAIANGGDVEEVRDWVQRLQENPVYMLLYKNEDWAKKAIEEAMRFVAGTSTT